MKKIVLVAVLAAAVSPAFAANRTGGFIGGQVGTDRVSFNDTASANYEDQNESASTWGVRGGYMFTPNWGAEAQYTHYGKKTVSHDIDFGNIDAEIKGWGVGVVWRSNTPGNQGVFSRFRGGVASNEFALLVPDFNVKDSKKKTTAYGGLGVGYDFNPNFNISGNFDISDATYENDGGGIDAVMSTFTVGAEFRF